jgi:tetratricopeptide (TPR) repeat protein
MSGRIDRASLLLEQSRYDLAANELRLALAESPQNPFAHALLAHALIGLNDFPAATEAAEQAIACGPDFPFAHYTLATALYHRNHYPEAEAAIREAIRLDPNSAANFSLLGSIRAQQEDWRGTLAAANEGLEHDPEHGPCLNLRAMALVKLGRQDEASATMEGALSRDPDNAFTHANRGWAYLHAGEPRRAIEHFREALRLQPDLDFARAGMIEAIKAHNWFYRQILGYFLWMSRLSMQARWGIIIGLLVLQQVIVSVSDSNPKLAPFLEPLLIAYVAFAVTTWTAHPLSNLLLRLSKFGRMALSRDERRCSNWVGGLVALALAGVVYGIAAPSPYDVPGWLGALGFMFVVLPVSGAYACQPGWPRRVMGFYAVGMFILASNGVALMFNAIRIEQTDLNEAIHQFEAGAVLLRWNSWAGLISVFLGSWLARQHPRR